MSLRFYQESPALTFDDVLLVPGASEVLPREVSLRTRFSRNVALDVPLVSAAMDTVTNARLAAEMARLGGIGVLHKNMTPEAQAAAVMSVKHADTDTTLQVAAAVGCAADDVQRVQKLVEAGVDAIVVDSAHGHSKGVLDRVAWVKKSFPSVDVVGGNVATIAAARALVHTAGADGVKVGIGPGSICTTRIVAGVGVPQISAIADVAALLNKVEVEADVPIIADGGIRYSGDIAKAIVAGASSCMLGSMFAGTNEAPGVVEYYGGQGYKCYRGMGSMGAMNGDGNADEGSSDRYFQAGVVQSKLVPEGIEGRVLCKGPLSGVVDQLTGGLRSSMGYTGCGDIPRMQTVPQFVRITPAGMKESHVHDVTITKEAPNYRI